ncbi:MAG: FAD-dependent oxidoreductase, partial [Pseudomonadota bacterium]
MAAALRLRAKGYAVTILDRAPRLGGRAQVFEREGFRHDAGPTVITAPFLLEELFSLFNRKLDSYVTLRELSPWYRFRFFDGDHFDYGGTVEDTERAIARISPDDVDGYRRLLDLFLRNLKPGEHRFFVRIKDSNGNIGESQEIAFQVLEKKPQKLLPYARAIRLLNRFAYGPEPEELADILVLGEKEWLKNHLNQSFNAPGEQSALTNAEI